MQSLKQRRDLPDCGLRHCRTQNLVHYQDEPGARIACDRCRKIFVKDAKIGWRVQGKIDA